MSETTETYDKRPCHCGENGYSHCDDLRTTVERLTSHNAVLMGNAGMLQRRVVEQDERIATLAASLTERDLAIFGIRAAVELELSSHAGGAYQRGWDDAVERLLEKLAVLPSPWPLAEAIGAVIKDYLERGSVFAPLLDRLAALTPASWREVPRG